MFEWLSDNRASIAAVLILVALVTFVWSIVVGRKQAKLTANDEVFGDPVRTKGGWFWAVCGVSALFLVWSYYSWGVGRAYFPDAANEMCQVAKLEEAVSPIKAALPIGSRYYKSTLLASRNSAQLDELKDRLASTVFTDAEKAELGDLIDQTRALIANSSNPESMGDAPRAELTSLAAQLDELSTFLDAGPDGLTPSEEALAQPKWGTTFTEIPILPVTARGMLFDAASIEAAEIAAAFNKVRNHNSANDALIEDITTRIDALKEAGPKWPYTVGWIDCLSQGKNLGRGILISGRWAEPHEAPPTPPKEKRRVSVPVDFPSWTLNRPFVRGFNALYYGKHFGQSTEGVVHPQSFFHPLDAVLNWNRIYGKRGFTQYQCVLPESAGRGAARRFLELLTQKGGASFLCVIKECGPQGMGMISFPTKGISIALDIAVRHDTQHLVDTLNQQVIEEGGRVYLAKDNFTRPEHFRAMEPRLDQWLEVRRKWDPQCRIRSAQSVRLLGDPE